MSRAAFEKKIAALEALRSVEDRDGAASQLGKALRDRNNYLASKAAAIVADLQLTGLVEDLAAAFDRFLEDPVKRDPQCWAKIAIARALRDLGYREPELYLAGSAHIQMEPVFGGKEDSAGPLRSVCALALTDCPLEEFEILTRLTDLLADGQQTVRIDAALAIAQLGAREGALPLRLKALLGDSEPEATGQCLASLLSLLGEEAVAFAERFLRSPDDDLQLEAIGALAGAAEAAAVEALIRFWDSRPPVETRRAVLTGLAASPLPQSADFLLSVLSDDDPALAETALRSLAASRFRTKLEDNVKERVEALDDPELRRLFEAEFA